MFFNTIFLLKTVIISKMYLHLHPNKGEYLPVSCTNPETLVHNAAKAGHHENSMPAKELSGF